MFKHLHELDPQKSSSAVMSCEEGSASAARFSIRDVNDVYSECTDRITAFLQTYAEMIGSIKKLHTDTLNASPWHRLASLRLDALMSNAELGRSLPIPVDNIVDLLKQEISDIEAQMRKDDTVTKECGCDKLLEFIDTLQSKRVTIAGQFIGERIVSLVNDGNRVLTYGYNSVIARGLIGARQEEGKDFEVTVIDAPPRYTGRRMLHSLQSAGIPCSYCLIGAASRVVKEADTILLGAHAYMANGAMVGPVGTAMVAVIANDRHKPILAVCETIKFCNQVQIDSVAHNELYPAGQMVSPASPLHGVENGPKVLNIAYDVTSADDIAGVITELGLFAPSAVPAVMREYSKDSRDIVEERIVSE
ncbi:Translation initiation factor eIF-2B subunit delta [Carpediemonas membranifera]|uniref:Translation initiation factor eIF2B subunit delta n=1 Tax=Carpediemonas membranifera TaxID=201153 RepID=A0A8J6C170_9EUKA|nr:Translation initiation factor eIF-2B subunit delta [Carpediemonas membranifera]|eukprot:KAG9397281.1 Translation initiation factor eIF-2B subunit delta [Carpediemonas membranifera]